MFDHVYPALSDHGDTETITRLLRRRIGGLPGDRVGERSQATELLARVTPALSDALRRYRDTGGT